MERELVSNEVGQGTIIMWTAASDATHSYDQGCVQALGVFFSMLNIKIMVVSRALFCKRTPTVRWKYTILLARHTRCPHIPTGVKEERRTGHGEPDP